MRRSLLPLSVGALVSAVLFVQSAHGAAPAPERTAAAPAPGTAGASAPGPDARVRVVVYDPDQVVKLEGFAGFQIHLQLAPGETVPGRTIAAGDANSFEVGVVGNNVFLRPLVKANWTNLTLVSNRRVYQFDYKVDDAPKGAADPRLVYSIRFAYPQDEARAARAQLEAQRAERRIAQAQAERPRNLAYDYCGSPSLKPTAAYDDGVHTRLTFGARSEIPAVFIENEDGTESLVNLSVEGGEVVVHRVVKRLVLRRGGLVGCVINQRFDGGGERLHTQTLLPGVQRITQGVGQ